MVTKMQLYLSAVHEFCQIYRDIKLFQSFYDLILIYHSLKLKYVHKPQEISNSA